ncbi:MAG: glycosyltransferase family 4 protein [Armatimonadetes bacterium]|nr:glycosyltransferase family 4 protein [Armatimonadota bacterium]
MPRTLIAIDGTLVLGESTGDSTYWTGLLSGLAEVESEFEFILLSDWSKPPNLDLPEERFSWLKLPNRGRRWFSHVTMPLAARKLGASAFHTQYTLSPLARSGITTIHDVSFFIGPQWFKPKDRFLLQKSTPISARRAAKVITVSETSKRDIVRFLRVPEDKVAVTYNAAQPHSRPTEPGPVLKALGIERPYLLTIGARWPRKNITLAIEAAGLLPEPLPHKLVAIGKEGWGAVGGNPRVISTGYLPGELLPAVYSGADLYLFPSHYEGFGIPMLEAFACGTPVLSSKGGALPEVSAGAAEIMSDATPAAWSAKIQELLADSSKLAQMRERGFARAAQFSWKETARRTLEVYREVCQ